MIGRDPETQRWAVTRVRGGRVSRWLMPSGRMFAVWHPGTKATHWFSTAIASEAMRLAPMIKTEIVSLLRGL
jgi:hypothetical protein